MRSQVPAQCINDCVTYHWSGNWAALVGIGICFLLLIAWMGMKASEPVEDDGR